MGKLKLFGAGDSYIEIEGELSLEFILPPSNKAYLAISDGSVFEVVYTRRGIWRFLRLQHGNSTIDVEPAKPSDGVESDYVTLQAEHPFTWVMMGTHFSTAETTG